MYHILLSIIQTIDSTNKPSRTSSLYYVFIGTLPDAAMSPTTTTMLTQRPGSTISRVLSSTPFLAFVVAYANFVDMFLFAIIIPILPFTLETRLELQETEIQHTISILLAVFGAAWFISSPLSALLADYASQFRFGRRACILASLAVLAGATSLLCFGNSVPVLMTGRALQGASSAFTLTCPQAMLAQRAGDARVGRYMGFVTLANALANVASPIIGGVMFNKFGYQSIFALSLGLIVMQVLLWLMVIEDDADGISTDQSLSNETLDLDLDLNHDTVCTFSTWTPRNSVVDKDIKTTTWSVAETDPDSDLDVISEKASITIIARNTTIATSSPPPPSGMPIFMRLLSSPRMLCTLLSIFVIYCIIISFDAILPLQSSLLFSFTSTQSGLAMAALYLPSLLGPLAGWASDRFGTRLLIIGGFVIASPLLLALRFVNHNSAAQIALFVVLIVAVGAAAAVIITPLSAEIARIVEAMQKEQPDVFDGKDALSQAYALQSCMISLACTIGPLWGLLTHSAGWNVMMLSLCIASVAMIIANVSFVIFVKSA